MPKIQQLSPHVADMIAAGEVVERPASAAKELVENAIDAGATHVTVELQNGGMTYLRVSDDGCGMAQEDAKTAFLRHATSKLREASDLEAIETLGFRGEALAAISAVSRIDLLTRPAQDTLGTSLHLEAGVITECGEAGCPAGTTIVVRDLFYNTPARLKFMKRDTVEASALVSAMQKLALAHPEVALRVLRDGEEQLCTAGDGQLLSAVTAVLGRQATKDFVSVESHYEAYRLSGFISRPTAPRGNRSNQIFLVNGRCIRSKTLTAALEEGYRNQMMVGRFPSCVLHLHLPEHLVDVNVHPAKTEVRFLREKEIFECVCYGVQGALARASGRVELSLGKTPAAQPGEGSALRAPALNAVPAAPPAAPAAPIKAKQEFFREMSAQDYRAFSKVMTDAPRPSVAAPVPAGSNPPRSAVPGSPVRPVSPRPVDVVFQPFEEEKTPPQTAPSQTAPLLSDDAPAYRLIGELFDTYLLVEQGRSLLLIDKHAAHERLLFEKFRKSTEPITAQLLLTPILFTPEREEGAVLLENEALLHTLGFALSEFGDGMLAVRQLPTDLSADDAAASLSTLAADLMSGKQLPPEALRDRLLHTVACKAAIKGGRYTDPAEREALVREVLTRDDLKYCPHGRPICAELSETALARQFKRT